MSSSCISIETQFRRCMNQHLGLPISDEEYEFLLKKYDTKGNGMINYCSFVDTMEKGELICSLHNALKLIYVFTCSIYSMYMYVCWCKYNASNEFS